MTAAAVVALMLAACHGLGLGVLRALGAAAGLAPIERPFWSLALGMGLLGWGASAAGMAGFYGTGAFAVVLALGTLGNLATLGLAKPGRAPAAPWGPWELFLLAALAALLVGDLLEGLSPPADADSLAYHFDLPKRFLSAGAIRFVPRAVDGAVPLLTQMTYGVALDLGGERAMTLWCMATGWIAGGLVYGLARRHLDRSWALATAVVFLATPAVVYGAGSGQVEARNAAYVLVAAAALAEARRSGHLGLAVLAGLAAGLYAATKYTGLLFLLAAGLVLVAQRRWLAHGIAFSAAAVAAGGQWYLWNYGHTGDPVFPMLYGTLPYGANVPWTPEAAEAFRAGMFDGERAVPPTLAWLVAFPVAATLFSDLFPALESGRTGFGPFLLLAAPFAAAGLWQGRRRLIGHPLLPAAALAMLFYAIWFLSGSSQRVRHLLPVYPLVLVCFAVAAARGARAAGAARTLAAGVLVTLALQGAGQGLFALNHLKRLVRGEDRDAFLMRNVRGYAPVPWINAHLGPGDRVLVPARGRNYLIDVPIFYVHGANEARIDIRPAAQDARRFYRQMRAQGVTHMIVGDSPARRAAPPAAAGFDLWRDLETWGCLRQVASFPSVAIASRTLPTLRHAAAGMEKVMRLRGPDCLPAGKGGTD